MPHFTNPLATLTTSGTPRASKSWNKNPYLEHQRLLGLLSIPYVGILRDPQVPCQFVFGIPRAPVNPYGNSIDSLMDPQLEVLCNQAAFSTAEPSSIARR